MSIAQLYPSYQWLLWCHMPGLDDRWWILIRDWSCTYFSMNCLWKPDYVSQFAHLFFQKSNPVVDICFLFTTLPLSLQSVALFQARQKMQSIVRANKRPVNSEELIKYAHRISSTHSVSAPDTWQQGDPRRPYPTGEAHCCIISFLFNGRCHICLQLSHSFSSCVFLLL